jgi:hypothetical protein
MGANQFKPYLIPRIIFHYFGDDAKALRTDGREESCNFCPPLHVTDPLLNSRKDTSQQ